MNSLAQELFAGSKHRLWLNCLVRAADSRLLITDFCHSSPGQLSSQSWHHYNFSALFLQQLNVALMSAYPIHPSFPDFASSLHVLVLAGFPCWKRPPPVGERGPALSIQPVGIPLVRAWSKQHSEVLAAPQPLEFVSCRSLPASLEGQTQKEGWSPGAGRGAGPGMGSQG